MIRHQPSNPRRIAVHGIDMQESDQSILLDYTALPYIPAMYTIIETDIFKRYAESIWRDGERHEFITWLAANPLAGDVIPGSGGLRKVRWSRSGMGKRGGTRVIYYNELSEGYIWLLIAYTKAKFDNLPIAFLNQLKEEISHGS